MEKNANSPNDLIRKCLFVQNLDFLGSTPSDKIRDKLTIHFQKRKQSHGGDVKEVIYPLAAAKGCAVVVFEDEKDVTSVVKHEQIFNGQLLQVDKLPPVFTLVRADIHPIYFNIMPTVIHDKIPESFERVAGVKVDISNCSRITCSLPSQLARVEEEIVHLALGKVGQSLSNINDDEYEAAGASGVGTQTAMAFQGDHEEANQDTRHPEDAEDVMSEEEPECFNGGLSVEMRDPENQRSGDRTTWHPETSDDKHESLTFGIEDDQPNQQIVQEQDVITIDKNIYRYIQIFDGSELQKLLPNFQVKMVREAKSPSDLEAVIVPTCGGVSAEDIRKAKDDFIGLYQNVVFSIKRKAVKCSKLTKGEMEDAAKKTQFDFRDDTVIWPMDGPPMECLILTRGDIDEVVRKFRGYAGLKSGKSLRSRAERDISSASQDVTTTAGSQFKKEVTTYEKLPPDEKQWRQDPKHGNPDDHPWDFTTNEGINVHIQQIDINKCHTVAVVIPSLPDLRFPGWGVANSVWSVVGSQLQQECRRVMAHRQQIRLQVTECVITPVSNPTIIYHSVIHAVIPSGSSQTFLTDLHTTFRNCLHTAAAYRLSSLAIPLMGSGLSKAPKRECADALVYAILNFSRETSQLPIIKEVHLVNRDNDSAVALKQSLQSALSVPTGVPKAGYDSMPASSATQSGAPNSTVASHQQSHPGVFNVNGNATGALMWTNATSHSQSTPSVAKPVVAPASNWTSDKGGAYQLVTTQPISYSDSVRGKGRGSLIKATAGQTTAASDTYGNQQANQGAVAGNPKTGAALSGAEEAKASGSKPDDCSICLSPMVNVQVLPKCKHAFCTNCIKRALQTNNSCPICRMPCGELKGNQPGGTMTYVISSHTHLDGYPHAGTITINYNIPSGIQSASHPNPGQNFYGASRTAYLPDNFEGREVLALLRRAFDARLIFSVGRSVTSGADNVVTWNDIHHKTSRSGGPQNYGYPDPDYLRRVKQDLAAKGIF